jgi:hypothetical protein
MSVGAVCSHKQHQVCVSSVRLICREFTSNNEHNVSAFCADCKIVARSRIRFWFASGEADAKAGRRGGWGWFEARPSCFPTPLGQIEPISLRQRRIGHTGGQVLSCRHVEARALFRHTNQPQDKPKRQRKVSASFARVVAAAACRQVAFWPQLRVMPSRRPRRHQAPPAPIRPCP